MNKKTKTAFKKHEIAKINKSSNKALKLGETPFLAYVGKGSTVTIQHIVL